MTIDGVPTRENLRNLREWASAGVSGSGEGEVLDAAGIREMQNFLNRYGYGIEIDGSFGPKTARALRRWQRSQDLKVDGLPNRLNLERLRRS
jgi:peptidoglycan hydrolase-like protein with peptidoglycan-binding domain